MSGERLFFVNPFNEKNVYTYTHAEKFAKIHGIRIKISGIANNIYCWRHDLFDSQVS